MNTDLTYFQNILNNNFNNKYTIEKFIGINNNFHLYKLFDNQNKNKKYIVKFIEKNDDTTKYIIEIGFIRALSLFNNSKLYINTYHDFSVDNKYIIVIMNIINGVSLLDFSHYIKDLTELEYYDYVIQIIKFTLKSLSYIHKRNISHQNININNIIISLTDYKNIDSIKFINFTKSCGDYIEYKTDNIMNQKCIINIANRINKLSPEYKYKTELIDHIKNIFKTNKNSIELYMAKKDDIWILGTLFWNLINRKEIGVNPFSIPFPDNNNKPYDYTIFSGYSKFKKIHIFITNFMLTPIETRKNANDLLNSFLILEKYGWEYI